MGLGKRLKKKVRKYIDKAKEYASKDPLVGQYINKPESESYSAAPQMEMKDVARSRAAGSGIFNYTDQEMRPK